MGKPIFRYGLQDGEGQYYYIYEGAVASAGMQPYYMFDVIEWPQMGPLFKRHERYHGVFDYVLPAQVSFCGDMAHITRYFYNRYDLLANLHLRMEVLNATTQLYDLMGTYKVDMSQLGNGLLTTEVEIMGGGLAETLLGYEDTVYEVPLNDEADKIKLDGISYLGMYHYQTESSAHIEITVPAGEALASQTIGIPYLSHEGSILPGAAKTESGHIAVDPVPDPDFMGGVLYSGLITSAFTIKASFPVVCNVFNDGGTQSKLQIRRYIWPTNDFTGPVDTSTVWDDMFRSDGGFNADVYIDDDFTVDDGKYLMLVFAVETDITASGIGSTITIDLPERPFPILLEHVTRLPATECRSRTATSLFHYLAYQLGGAGYEMRSDLLASEELYSYLKPSAWRFTCGDAIRRIYTDASGNAKDPAIKTTMRDFQRNAFLKLCVGMGIERDEHGNEILRLEHLSYFYQKDVVIADLGESINDEYRLEPYNLYRANNIKLGYKDQTYDDLNGRFEFNTSRDYRTNITTKLQDADNLSPYRADIYGIEVLRAMDNKVTTDNTGDDNVFMVHTQQEANGDGLYEPDRTESVNTGVPEDVRPSIYNGALSPVHDTIRLMPWWLSNYGGALLNVDYTIKLQSAAKNGIIVWNGLGTTENNDIVMDAYTATVAPLFQAKKMSVNVVVPPDIYSLMEANPYGVIKFRLKGVEISLFVLQIGQTPGTNDSFNLQGLLSPDVELPRDF